MLVCLVAMKTQHNRKSEETLLKILLHMLIKTMTVLHALNHRGIISSQVKVSTITVVLSGKRDSKEHGSYNCSNYIHKHKHTVHIPS